MRKTPVSLKKYSFHNFLRSNFKSNFAFVCFFSKKKKFFTSKNVYVMYMFMPWHLFERYMYRVCAFVDHFLRNSDLWNFGWVKSFFSEVKTYAPYFTFCDLFWQHLPFPKHIFLNAPEIGWCLLLSKILKAKYNVKELVNFIFMLRVIFILPNLFKKLFCFEKLWSLLVLQFNYAQQF